MYTHAQDRFAVFVGNVMTAAAKGHTLQTLKVDDSCSSFLFLNVVHNNTLRNACLVGLVSLAAYVQPLSYQEVPLFTI